MDKHLKVTIERDECIKCSVCWDTCPDVFEAGDDGLSQIVEKYREEAGLSYGTIPIDLMNCAIEASDGCPVSVIALREERP